MENNRDRSIDVAKGLTMLMVIWVHCCYNMPCNVYFEIIRNHIQTMYMPCFFILSGFFAKDTNLLSFLRKKSDGLLKPLFFTYFLSLILIFLGTHFLPIHIKGKVDILSLIFSKAFPNGPIWFLSALFFALLLNLLISKIKQNIIRILCVISTFFLGFYWSRIFHVRLPLFWDSGLTATVFIVIGKYTKEMLQRIPSNNNMYALLSFSSFCFSLLFTAQYSMLTNTYDTNPLCFLWKSICGTFSVVFLSKLITNSRILEYIGRNSLIVLCTHMFIIMGVGAIFPKNSNDYLPVPLCFVITIVSMWMIVPSVKKTFPFIYK